MENREFIAAKDLPEIETETVDVLCVNPETGEMGKKSRGAIVLRAEDAYGECNEDLVFVDAEICEMCKKALRGEAVYHPIALIYKEAVMHPDGASYEYPIFEPVCKLEPDHDKSGIIENSVHCETWGNYFWISATKEDADALIASYA